VIFKAKFKLRIFAHYESILITGFLLVSVSTFSDPLLKLTRRSYLREEDLALMIIVGEAIVLFHILILVLD